MKLFTYIVIAIVAGSVIAGFFIVGSPQQERMRRFDSERLNHLQMIQGEIINYWLSKSRLPLGLDELTDSIRGFRAPNDPETNDAYIYIRKDDLLFELCATFVLPSDGYNGTSFAVPTKPEPARAPYPQDLYSTWEHGVGYTCFERKIDPDIYKPFVSPK